MSKITVAALYNAPMPFELMFPPLDMSFSKETDIQETEQFGFVKLNESYDKGVIPGVLESGENEYNGVSDPETLMPRAHDWFERQRQALYVRSSLKQLSSKEKAVVEKSAEAAASVTSGEN